jgi:signal transduction histidine kinase
MSGHGGRMTAIRAVRPLAAATLFFHANGVFAATAGDAAGLGLAVTPSQIVFLSALVGVTAFAVWSVIMMMRARQQAESEAVALRAEVADLRAAADRAEALINGEDQRFVAWGAPGEPPLVAGGLPADTGAPSERAAFLAFGTWLQPESAARLDRAVVRLRDHGEKFSVTLATTRERLVEASGRTVGGLALVRFRELTGDRLALAEVAAEYQLFAAEVDALRAMLSAAPMPIWLRDADGRLAWVNAAFAAAVGAKNETDAVDRQIELLDANARRALAEAHRSAPVSNRQLPVIVTGNRRIFDVSNVVSDSGSAGIAVDVTATGHAEAALVRQTDFNASTLDQLATAVASFDPDRRLVSCNTAYRTLFGFDDAFIKSRPDENAVLDRLRAARKLPEQSDFRIWRADLLSAYQSTEARTQWWHLPDGQTLRVIANPAPQGGITWIYENVTERLDLESRYNALIRVQGETLDHLAEGVAVFGSDGRLRLNNPAFAAIWELDSGRLAFHPHISEIAAACRQPGDAGIWDRLTAAVAGVDDNRPSISGRLERADGMAIDYAAVPLPGGQTMITFVDVTDSARVARALVERNEALEAADTLKTAFVQHVSYQLRSPLTNIIGFAQLLAEPGVGPLNDKQREYTGYIMSSSAALLAIVNDILDLATIDAGIMELELSEVDIAETVEAAIDGIRDRIEEGQVRLETEIPTDIGGFVADGKRIRQILFNLLANAIAFSPAGGRVLLSAARVGDAIEFKVSDNGPGIASDFLGSVFERFASKPSGAARGGAGLGLSIVKSLAHLHGGVVDILSGEGRGVTVICRFPARPDIAAAAE